MFMQETSETTWTDFKPHSDFPEETQHENARERIDFGGPGLEIFRSIGVEKLKRHIAIFCEHGSVGDISAVCAAFELLDSWEQCRKPMSCPQATFIDAFLVTLGIDPAMVLKSNIQKVPI